MAVKTFYLKNVAVNAAYSLQDGGTPPATAASSTGWVVAKSAPPNYSLFLANTKRANTSFAAADALATPNLTANSCWRSENTLNGIFAATPWTLAFRLRGANVAGGQTGSVNCRIWKSTTNNATAGTNTELTTAVLVGADSGAITTAASSESDVTWTPAAPVTFNNEYLFVQCEWQINTASSATTSDVVFYIEPAAVITTSDFAVPTASGDLTPNASLAAGVSASDSESTAADIAAGAAAVAGTATGVVAGAVTASGVLAAAVAAVSGSGRGQSAATGSLAAQIAAAAGAGISQGTATGSLAAQAPAVAGAGRGQGTATASLASANAAISGAALLTAAGAIGGLSAQPAAVAGTATAVAFVAATGALAAQPASIAGHAAPVDLAAGVLDAGASAMLGTGNIFEGYRTNKFARIYIDAVMPIAVHADAVLNRAWRVSCTMVIVSKLDVAA